MNTQGQSSTLNELAQIRAEARNQVSKKTEETPVEAAAEGDPAPAAEETVQAATTEGEAAPAAEAAPAPAAAPAEEEVLIKIGDQTFKTESAAIEYANKLAHEKEVNEAYNSGIQEAIAAAKPAAAPAAEEDFDTKFYTDPKSALAEVQRKARDEAVAAIRAEQTAAEQWRLFEEENPDLVGQRDIAQKVLQDNWETLGKMTDYEKARKILATKVRGKFQQWAEAAKPRTELPAKKGQVVSAGGSQSVTPAAPAKKVEKPLDFVSQLKANRKR